MLKQKGREGRECQLKQTVVGDQVVMAELVSGAEIQGHRGLETGDVLLRGRVVSLS